VTAGAGGPRVGFDVTALLAGDTGVARYVRELGAALERRGVELVRYALGRGDGAGLPVGTRRRRVPLRVVQRSRLASAWLSAERLAPGCDLVHVPDLVPPPATVPLVLTVHDLVALEHPALHPSRAAHAQQLQLDAARDVADVVLAVSQATADALVRNGVPQDRIVVAPNGVTTLPAPDRSVAPARPFLLAVGAITPRKGLALLASAFAAAALPPETVLVLAGADGWDAARVVNDIASVGAGDRVVRTGRVTDGQLAALYRECIAVCVPSVAEGFGLPVIEAAAAGAPVVASDLAVFRELDTGALLVPAGDVTAWSAALERVAGDRELRAAAAARADHIECTFSWDRTAAITIAAYERARAGKATASV
jgi:glycosyltransferase involved in cell wall biosynthesis